MATVPKNRRIFVFSAPSAELITEETDQYYRECRIAGAPSVEVELDAHSSFVFSATRYLPADVVVGATVVDGVLQVICTRGSDGGTVTMGKFTDWTAYTVHRAQP